ncbi:uncharacterized protein LOC143030751 [Oratosquilla oratoria]|uniref:uncharacterized protein LOC143030751 n=1 Tax=Oratosquilla oratoria TaxID=337810 RepID=UPI003F761644
MEGSSPLKAEVVSDRLQGNATSGIESCKALLFCCPAEHLHLLHLEDALLSTCLPHPLWESSAIQDTCASSKPPGGLQLICASFPLGVWKGFPQAATWDCHGWPAAPLSYGTTVATLLYFCCLDPPAEPVKLIRRCICLMLPCTIDFLK